MAARRKTVPDTGRPVTLKILAEYLDLSPATVSIVLNNSPVAKSISPQTRQRVLDAAKKFEYRPNLHARMLRTRLTNTVGVIVPELSEGYFTGLMIGVEQYLLQAGYLYELGHRRIAFMKGQRFSLDSESRWTSIQAIAQEIGITIRPELCIYLEKNSWSPELGYPPVRDLLTRTRDFTAIFCFNDTA